MCRFCLPTHSVTRRAFQAGLVALAFSPARARASNLIEPHLSLDLPPGPRTVALTLDACGGSTDWRILDTLSDLAVTATIFVTGLWLARNPDALARLRARPDLFSLQNHGARHLPAVLGTNPIFGLRPAGTQDAIAREVAGGAAAVIATGAPPPRWYRTAAGFYSPAALPQIEAAGFAIAGYSLVADAGASLPAETVTRRMVAARSGDVIIAHINQPTRSSGAGVAAGIRALHAAGVQFAGLPYRV
jgi:peptidoglycan/xylan/chitin deacetylase (PgdA/CDA1 family)